MTPPRHRAAGLLLALAGIAALSAAMVPARHHLSVATPALVLLVPVVAGVAVGGFGAGLVAAAAGFLAYDLLFLPPYSTLSVHAGQDWVALVVYVVVVLVVSRLVSFLQAARAEARRQEETTRRLYDLVDRLIVDRPLTELLQVVLATVQESFHPRWVAALLPGDSQDGPLEVAATAGAPLEASDRALLLPSPGQVQSVLSRSAPTLPGITRIALASTGRPVGVLALADVELTAHDRELLGVFAHQAAQAVERSQLREQALRAEVLEESDQWRRALMGAVSHDLRTPLAAIKTAVTTLREDAPAPGAEAHATLLNGDQRAELLELIETQADGLARLVTDLLDLSRLESGALRLQREPTAVEDIVEAAVASLGAALAQTPVEIALPRSLPPVDVDELLMVQVVVNLLENASRHSPEGAAVRAEAVRLDDTVQLAVVDHGPGVPRADRQHIFERFDRGDGGGRAGLGLAIARAFVEAHDQQISVEDAAGGGARFVVTLPVAPVEPKALPRPASQAG